MRSNYTVVAVNHQTVFLVDNDESGCRSVTNDAENVVKEVFSKYGDKKIMYCDSGGCWDQLTHNHGNFIGFKTGHTPNE